MIQLQYLHNSHRIRKSHKAALDRASRRRGQWRVESGKAACQSAIPWTVHGRASGMSGGGEAGGISCDVGATGMARARAQMRQEARVASPNAERANGRADAIVEQVSEQATRRPLMRRTSTLVGAEHKTASADRCAAKSILADIRRVRLRAHGKGCMWGARLRAREGRVCGRTRGAACGRARSTLADARGAHL
jgi:hypothetical protein